jgi:hypothetical protein
VVRLGRRRRAGCGFDVTFQLAGVLVAAIGFLLKGVQDNLVEPDIHAHLARRRREPAERQFAREHFVKHDAQRINVRAVID